MTRGSTRAQRIDVLILGAIVAVALGACGTKEPEYVERPVHDIYNQAVDSLDAGNFKQAGRLFDEVERQHPYSAWSTKAQIMAAFASYQANDYDQAVIALDRFIQLHPGNRDVAYAYYLRALSYYERISDVKRDQLVTQRAMDSLQEIMRRFPDSRFARDAKLKYDLTRDHLAGKEMEIGRYYLRLGHHLAAINRFRRVIDEYQTTTHVPEALHRLVESYTALGILDEARKAAAVLGHNFPGSEWYIDSYALATGTKASDIVDGAQDDNGRSRGFFSRTFSWLF